MTVDIEEALRELLPDRARSEPTTEDLIAAAREAWRRRHANTLAGGAVLSALHDAGLTYRQISEMTGIPPATAQRWARPPEQDQDQ